MTFKRMMALGAVAAALAFTGCRDRSQSEQDLGTGRTGYQPEQPATGGSGNPDSIPGGSNTIGGTPQDARPGTELGGTGVTPRNDVGGTTNDAVTPPSDTVTPPSTDLDHNGTGGSGMDMDTNTLPQDSLDQKNLDRNNPDPNSLDQRNQLDDTDHIGSDEKAR